MLPGVLATFVALASAVAPAPAPTPPAPAADWSFARDVRPILSNRCFRCHGPDAAAREADLRLDLRDDAIRPRRRGAAIVPGDPDASLLLQRVQDHDPERTMPPPEAGPPLSAREIEILRRWIAAGAVDEPHWAFQPIRAVEPPPIDDPTAVRNPIDAFVHARRAAAGLAPNPEADRRTLARRVALDLTGLPLDPERVDAFVADPAPDAYERLVDELLASPAYGERWASVWLDFARYADTKGYEKDDRRTIWPWRDWVIRAFNDDLPFDAFTRDQLAGDLLEAPTIDQRLATAFHRNTMTNDEGGTDDEEFRVAAVIDRVNTTMTVWTGLTAGCAQCHDHKYDPLSMREYYALYAFLDQTADADRPDEEPRLAVAPALRADALAELRALRRRVAAAGEVDPVAQRAELASLDARLAALEADVPRVPVLADLPEDMRRTTRILEKGSHLSPGAVVTPDVPAFLPPLPDDAPRDRRGLAAWLVAPEHPLTARVLVNRWWERFFGHGLVATTEDFGLQGDLPTHPDLLDWLARDVVAHGWSLRHLCRRIVTSATYRQSSAVRPELLERDPDNVLLARGPRFRLDAEMVRDQALAASGLLDRTRYGPPVFPEQPEGVWQVVYSGDRWETSPGSARHRRALYTFWRRTSPYPSLITFDAPSREFCTIRRIRTNTPLQALVTLNDPVALEAARALAERSAREAGDDPAARIDRMLRLVLARPATAAERAVLLTHRAAQHALLDEHPDDAATLAGTAVPDAAERAAWVMVAHVILNLDETLTRG